MFKVILIMFLIQSLNEDEKSMSTEKHVTRLKGAGKFCFSVISCLNIGMFWRIWRINILPFCVGKSSHLIDFLLC